MKIFLKKENLYYQNLLIYDIIIGLFKKFSVIILLFFRVDAIPKERLFFKNNTDRKIINIDKHLISILKEFLLILKIEMVLKILPKMEIITNIIIKLLSFLLILKKKN